jgi:hypothetical protein
LGPVQQGIPFWRLSQNTIAGMERALKLPAGSYPLQEYRRYYSVDTLSSHHVVEGYFIRNFVGSPGDKPGIYINQSHGTIMDGGCDIIVLHYDVDAHVLIDARCNGLG